MTARAQLELLALTIGKRFAEERATLHKTVTDAMRELAELGTEVRASIALVAVARSALKDGADGAPGPPGPPGANGKDGENGQDGKAGESIAGAPGEAGAKGDKGDRGDPGERGDRGETGAEGPRGSFDAPEEWNESRIYYQGQLAFIEGSTYCARRDTARRPPHGDWSPVALAGRDGRTGDPRGGWDPNERYLKLDRVTHNGSEWIARQDEPGALPGAGWMLGAQRRVGRPGERGERGEQGPQGIGIKGAELEEWSIRLELSDGRTIGLDLRPLFERYTRERDGR